MSTCKYCDIVSDFLLYTISNGEQVVSVCPNHSASENFIDSDIKASSDHKCIICGKDGYNFKSDEIDKDLCEDHIYSLVDVKLTPGEYFKLKESIGIANINSVYLLHDDFYCEESGEALQPSDIDRGKLQTVYMVSEFYNLYDPDLEPSVDINLFKCKADAEVYMADLIFELEAEFNSRGYEINTTHEKSFDCEFYKIFDFDDYIHSEISLQPMEVK